MNGVSIKPKSASHKLAPIRYEDYLHPKSGRTFRRPFPVAPFVASTYVSIRSTCPDTCPMKDAGCYAQQGFTAHALRLLDAQAAELRPRDVIAAEALAIRRLFVAKTTGRHSPENTGRVPQDGYRGRGRDLRLHMAGDVPRDSIDLAVNQLAQAAHDWRARGGGDVWTYTHQWAHVARAWWGPIKVLASCETPRQVREARARQYAAALLVTHFPNGPRAFRVANVPGVVVPCPAQTKESVTCATCRLCMADLVKLNVTIGFAPHGSRAAKVMAKAHNVGHGPHPARVSLPVVR